MLLMGRLVVAQGATLARMKAGGGAEMQGWIQDPVTVTVGGAGRVPAGLQHRYLLVSEDVKLPALCRLLRQDLLECASTSLSHLCSPLLASLPPLSAHARTRTTRPRPLLHVFNFRPGLWPALPGSARLLLQLQIRCWTLVELRRRYTVTQEC